jgi:hypothetical protein
LLVLIFTGRHVKILLENMGKMLHADIADLLGNIDNFLGWPCYAGMFEKPPP